MSLFKRIVKRFENKTKESERFISKSKIIARNEAIEKYYELEKTNSLKSCLACKNRASTIDYDFGLMHYCELKSPFYSSDKGIDCSKQCRYFNQRDILALGKEYLEEDKKFLEEKQSQEELIDPPLEHHTY